MSNFKRLIKLNEADYDTLFQKLVPGSGPADTAEGEMLRAISKIAYRYSNDGDYFFKGYGKETAGPAYRYLISKDCPLSSQLKPLLSRAQKGALKGDHPDQYEEGKDPYLDNINKAVDLIVSYASRGKYEENDVDMLRY